MFLTSLFLMVFTAISYGQGLVVKGVVSTTTGETLPGATVVIKGSTAGTMTGIDGDFSLRVPNPSTDILVVSFLGFESQEVSVNGRSSIDVKLSVAYNQLDEVVAIGYGTSTRRDLTGSVSSADMQELSKVPVSNLGQALGGRIAGLQVQASEGGPGAKIKLRVRGGGSITQDNEPLYVIDGFQSDDGIDILDPSEIASIDVLKDASATAIYGARGANGVVLITTKGGKEGKTRVSYDGYYGSKRLDNKLDVLNPHEYVLLDYERELTDNVEDMIPWFNRYGSFEDIDKNYLGRPGVDWQEEMFGRSAINQHHKLSVSGGTKKTKYNLSFSHSDEEGIMINSGLKMQNISFNFNHEVSDRLKMSTSIRYAKQKYFGMGVSSAGGRFNKLAHTIRYRPTIGIIGTDQDLIELDEDPIFVDDSGNVMQNPLTSAKAEHNENEKRVLSLNTKLDYNILKNLTYTLTVGLRTNDQRREQFYGERSMTAKRSGGPYGSIRNQDVQGYSYSNVLNYTHNFKKDHKLSLMLGQEEIYNKNRWFQASSNQFPNDDIGLGDLSLGALPGVPSSNESDDLLLSFFGRANYSFTDKYLLTATMRADGSSKFGAGNKYGYFPSASGAWRASEEEFIKSLDLFSNLKLRVSYGVAGNNRIPNYQSLALLSSNFYGINNGTQISFASAALPNPNLKWETTYSQNLGLDLGFLDQRIQITADAYRTKTKDLLLRAQVPITSGYSSMIINVGETQNTGLELALNTVNISNSNFEWTTNFNISFNKNKVLKLTDDTDRFLYESGWGQDAGNDYIVQVGEAIGSMYGFVTDGLYQVEDFNYDPATEKYTLKEGLAYNPNWQPEPGYWKMKDISGPNGEPDGLVDSHDRTIIGNANPVHFGGISNFFRYKNFDFSVFLNWSYGNDVYNANKMDYLSYNQKNRNTLKIANDRWMTIDGNGNRVTDPTQLSEMNKGKTMPVFKAGDANNALHSWVIEDGSFLKINNISLGYTFPKVLLSKINVSSLRLYTTLYNIHTFTSYSGFDPEVSTREGSGVTPGVDYGAYPKSKSFVVGVNLSF